MKHRGSLEPATLPMGPAGIVGRGFYYGSGQVLRLNRVPCWVPFRDFSTDNIVNSPFLRFKRSV